VAHTNFEPAIQRDWQAFSGIANASERIIVFESNTLSPLIANADRSQSAGPAVSFPFQRVQFQDDPERSAWLLQTMTINYVRAPEPPPVGAYPNMIGPATTSLLVRLGDALTEQYGPHGRGDEMIVYRHQSTRIEFGRHSFTVSAPGMMFSTPTTSWPAIREMFVKLPGVRVD
jgi:hypothetical protein